MTKNNTLEVLGSKNTKYILKQLDLSHPIDWNENDIMDFIIDQQCNPVYGVDLKFINQPYHDGGHVNSKGVNYSLLNQDNGNTGYWFVRKIESNAFIVLNLGKKEPESIFQITSITLNGLKFQPIQEYKELQNLRLITTCL
ncbi:hypothetical protein [Maribacter sp. MAR_2009_72]|uniref:hypothetical protein n=1 Tax=Maribacter sp. MAR_2009_72 TaxID=1250050 RepID=UPI00119BE39A|nr:hypothetical protein [Maribacter sp. MAR_2009_72]TVZ17280.1 hypothetical protein JM81_3558 [Maribacter sp. MAR_2009_72]